MAEVKNNTQTQQPNKKKKSALQKFFISLLVIFVIVPSALIGLIYALFYDSTHTPIHVRESYPIQEVVNDMAVHSLDDTVLYEEMRLKLTEDAINQIFHDAIEMAGDHAKTVKNFYIRITQTEYIFVFELDFDGWFKSRAFFYTQLRVTDEQIIFKINNVKFGRVGKLNYLTRILAASKAIPDINKILADNGIHMKFNLYDLEFDYRFDKLAEDLASKLGPSSSEYIMLIKEMILNKKFIELIPNSDKSIEADLLLYNMRPTQNLFNIANYQMPAGYLDAIMGQAIAKTKMYLQSGIVAPAHAQDVLNYYVQGYDHLTSEQKANVDIYLSSITPATNTYNYTIPDSEHLDSIVIDQISSYLPGDDHIEAHITTTQVDRALSEAETIGESMLFKSKSESNEYTCNFVTFDRFNNVIDSTTQSLFLTVSVSFNGYDIGLTLKTTLADTTQFGKAKFSIEGFYLGDENISEGAYEKFTELMANAINSESFGGTLSMETVGDTTFLVFDVSSILNGMGISEADGYVTTFSLLPQTATTPGTLLFSADK